MGCGAVGVEDSRVPTHNCLRRRVTRVHLQLEGEVAFSPVQLFTIYMTVNIACDF